MDTPLPAAAPRWSARSYTEADRGAVLDMYTEPDFYFRTHHPDTLAQDEVLALLADGVRVLAADGTPVGLYALAPIGGPPGCHQEVQLRLRAAAPDHWWRSAYDEIVRCARWRTEVVRLSVFVEEFDERVLRLVRGFGLTEEGTLTRVTSRHGVRSGRVHFGQIWAPAR